MFRPFGGLLGCSLKYFLYISINSLKNYLKLSHTLTHKYYNGEVTINDMQKSAVTFRCVSCILYILFSKYLFNYSCGINP
jgi:hypothetical protein